MARRSRRTRSFRPGRLAARCAVAAALLLLAATAGLVALLRVVDPPLTAVMLHQPMPLEAIEHDWVARADIAVELAHAVIAAEDQRFLLHNGFDVASIERAVRDFRDGSELRGASTITQQVAKNLFLWPERSFLRKGIEAYFALLIEVCWPKERILEVYLNIAEFAPGVFGAEAAAKATFGVAAAQIDAEQAALLAAVLPSPRRMRAERPSGYVRQRQARILSQMRSLDASGHYRALAW